MSLISRTGWTMWRRKTFPNIWENVKIQMWRKKYLQTLEKMWKIEKFWHSGRCYIGVTKVYVLPFRHLILCFLSKGGLDVFSSSHHFSPLCPVFISYMVPLFRASIGWECYAMLTMITVQPNERITSSDKDTREGNDNIVTQRHHNTMTWWHDYMMTW